MMIANEMREYCYGFEEMAKILKISPATLKQRIYRRRCVPPFQKEGDEYWFPKELFSDWIRSRPVVFEVGNAS